MCFRELMDLLHEKRIEATESQIRWAMKTGKVSRPPLDGSLRFNFGPQQVSELLALFKAKDGSALAPERVADRG
jgi:hypothetical protein